MSKDRSHSSHAAPLRRGDAPALRDRRALLRRFVMAEVLAPPLSLRGKREQYGKATSSRKER